MTAIAGLQNMRSIRMGSSGISRAVWCPNRRSPWPVTCRMPRAKLSVLTVPRHEARGVLRSGNLDVAIASGPEEARPSIRTEPLRCDRFVIAAPGDHPADPDTLLIGRAALPFLRFNPAHLIGRQIEAHLARNRINLPNRYSFDSAQSIMAIVANGDRWGLITPLGFLRAQRYAERVRLHYLPRAILRAKNRLAVASPRRRAARAFGCGPVPSDRRPSGGGAVRRHVPRTCWGPRRARQRVVRAPQPVIRIGAIRHLRAAIARTVFRKSRN